MDPRVRRTRKLLQDALRSLLFERRFSRISVQDIAERATVNRATFYAHYEDKHGLAADVLKTDLRTAVIQRFTERPTLTYENLVELAVAVFGFLGDMSAACPETAAELQDTVGTTVQEALYEITSEWLSDSATHQRLFPGCAKETVATVLSWSIYGGAQHWSRSDRRIPAAKMCREIISILLSPSKA
jgi:AcrR family transcriptional regulator